MFFQGLFKVLGLFLQGLVNILGGFLGILCKVLPSSPFNLIDSSQYADFLSKINYFIPFYEFVVIMESWLICISIYYIYSVWARWIKMIE